MVINSKSTKLEILAAYKELEKQNKNLESEIKKSLKNNLEVNQSLMTTSSKKSSTTINEISTKDMLNTIQSLEQIQTGFGGAVSNLSEQLITEATKLETIRNAIAQEILALETLHQLTEVEETTIDILLDQYQTNKQNFTRELSQQQETSQQEIEVLQQAWMKEQEIYKHSIQTRNENYDKIQQRTKEEYEYNLLLARNLEEENYVQEKKIKQQELAETRQVLEQQWQSKEIEISKQEKEYTAAIEAVAAFEEQLRAKIKQGTEEGKGIGTYQTKIKADLRIKEIEGETQNYQLRIASLEQTITQQDIRINKLSQQLDAALQQVQNLAVKAIEGTSNRNSFEAMKAIAIEQVKTQQKNK